jgi:hypothetical protein
MDHPGITQANAVSLGEAAESLIRPALCLNPVRRLYA